MMQGIRGLAAGSKGNSPFSTLDRYFGEMMVSFGEDTCPELYLAAVLASSQTRLGHICLDIGEMAERRIDVEEDQTVFCPPREIWLDKLRHHPVVGRPGDAKPMILDDRFRLYLYRYWMYQKSLIDFIVHRYLKPEDINGYDKDLLKQRLERLFPGTGHHDAQKIAALVSLVSRISVISGGPGTGKTTTVAKFILLFIETMLDGKTDGKVSIRLCAPTGKAAQRLEESLGNILTKLDISENISASLPEGVSTIHRMLGTIPGSPYFRYNQTQKLPVDLVVVDEASMVDLALMSKLVQAIPDHARLVLVGDQDQLSSVEAGAVMGDICNSGNNELHSRFMGSFIENVTGIAVKMSHSDREGLFNSITVLSHNWRFGGESGIGRISRAVNAGDVTSVRTVYETEAYSDVEFMPFPKPGDLKHCIRQKIIEGYGGYIVEGISGAFAMFDRFRILCAVRKGTYGVENLNRTVEQILVEEGIISGRDRWYAGRPVMISENDYSLGLFNGDVGIAFPDPASENDLKVFFVEKDGRTRSIRPEKLPAHETAFAMTIHKGQGSEFDNVFIILPDRESPVLSRELIYTAITRAKNRVCLMTDLHVLCHAVEHQTERRSGLRDALWG